MPPPTKALIGLNDQNGISLSEWMLQQSHLEQIRLITCGDVGAGKSTLIRHLLLQPQEPLPAPLAENHTSDTTYRFFSTPQRAFISADIPGDEKNTRHLITEASTAEAAVLVIDAREGLGRQARRHAYLLSQIGIQHVVLAINKMDLVNYDRNVFDSLLKDFQSIARSLGITSVSAIPLSVTKGDNIATRSVRTRWYQGSTLMGCLETLEIRQSATTKVIFPVQCVNHLQGESRSFSGTLAAGQIAQSDEIRITASGQTAKVARIITADGDLSLAQPGDAITLKLDRAVDAARGDVIALAEQPLEMTDQFEANLVWLHDEPGLVGRTYELKLANQSTTASITTLKYRVEVNSLAHESCRQLGLSDIAVANLALSKAVVFEPYPQSQALGGFILVDKFTHTTVAVGMIRHNLRRAQNVHRQALSITRQDREQLNGHKGKVIWFTGLSGSGKSTIANALEVELHAQGKHSYILDGDNIRQGLNKDLGFTDADRVENIRRVAETAKLMMDAGLIVMTAFISPFRAEREMARELIGENNFIEVFVNTPLEVCEQRDPKGLYKKARSGQLPNMTGINSPYELPLSPNLTVTSMTATAGEVAGKINSYLKKSFM